MTEEERFVKRIEELADISFRRDIPTNTFFMDMHEQDVFLRTMNRRRGTRYALSGGFPSAERRLAVFLPAYIELDNESEGSADKYGDGKSSDGKSSSKSSDGKSTDGDGIFPIVCVEAAPVAERFAESLSHRDYLGALMSLGIDRNRIGDIRIEGKCAWFACLEEISGYLCDNLTSVRHTQVSCRICDWPKSLAEPQIEERTGTVSSERADAIVAMALRVSRSEAAELIRQELVFSNARQVHSVSDTIKAGDIISVRHKGRFVYYGAEGTSKKGRIVVRVGLYR